MYSLPSSSASGYSLIFAGPDRRRLLIVVLNAVLAGVALSSLPLHMMLSWP
jgi:hypothetical protein